MVIAILSIGTRGDTQPYVALGVMLKKLGHKVRIAAFENYADFIQSYGLDFYPLQGNIAAFATEDEVQDAVKADNPLKVALSFNKMKSYVFDLQKDFLAACTGADAVVYHPGAAIGYFIAQQLKIPSILATPFPMTPTREYPALIFYNSVRLGETFNWISHLLFTQILWSTTKSPIQQFWKNEFGSIPVGFSCPFGKQNTQDLPTIVSCSNFVFPKPQDWPEHVHNTGYWFLDEGNWTPPQDLVAFLENGIPPVYVGFGSIGDPALAAQTTELIIDALRRTGQRGILATGWKGLEKSGPEPENIFFLESAPHSWLFPKTAAIIHHGGAGTTAAGIRAGVPNIIIPYGNDQFAWGRRVFELGVGPQPIPRKKLTSERLSKAIQQALSAEMQAKARGLGEKIKREQGAETAARIIQNCIEKKSQND